MKMSKNEEYLWCPKCESAMTLRSGPYSEFYGCLRYPNCNGTRQIEEGYGKLIVDNFPHNGYEGKCIKCESYPYSGSLSSQGLCPNCQEDFDNE